MIAEIDFERNEVVGAANISGDKQLIEDINTNFDMHSHWTNVIFGWKHLFEEYKTNKELENYRYLTKNNWTFANFYKAGNKSIAESFRKFEVYVEFLRKEFEKTKTRLPFEKWIIERSEEHILNCQSIFYKRYSRFKEWQDERIEFYNTHGYIETPLGFRRHYPMQTTEIINFDIQATSYHILADACIRIEKRTLKEGFKSQLRGQIHDSLFLMIHVDEILEMIDLVNHEMINHNLPNVNKFAKLGTEWKVGVNWGQMRNISSLL
jgi:DNA polymerase I-like protein with 3'-5' exonuclease and polymerase domains